MWNIFFLISTDSGNAYRKFYAIKYWSLIIEGSCILASFGFAIKRALIMPFSFDWILDSVEVFLSTLYLYIALQILNISKFGLKIILIKCYAWAYVLRSTK